jgi:hypothetical protein
MPYGKFGTAINCRDGRVQLPVINWMKECFKLDCVDMITEPGADKAVGNGWYEKVEEIKAKVLVSVNAHGSRLLVIAGHDDCAGNPVSPEQHKAQLREAVKVALDWKLPLDQVIAIWIDKGGKVEALKA